MCLSSDWPMWKHERQHLSVVVVDVGGGGCGGGSGSAGRRRRRPRRRRGVLCAYRPTGQRWGNL